MARNKRSFANRQPFTPTQVKHVCENWPLLERFALHATTSHRWTFDEDVFAFRKAGMRAFGAWRFKVEDCGEHAALDFLKDQGLTVSSLSWAGGFAYGDGEAYDAAIVDAIEAVEMAQHIHASTLMVLPGTRGAYTVNHGRRMIIEALRKVADAADKAGVEIALQPVSPEFAGDGCFIDSLDSMLEFLTDCGHPRIGLNLDLFHLRDTPNLISRIPELLPWIRVVQLSDCHPNPKNELDRCLLGAGKLPLAEVVQTLEAVGYKGFYEAPLMSTNVWNSNYDQVIQHTQQAFKDLAGQRVCP